MKQRCTPLRGGDRRKAHSAAGIYTKASVDILEPLPNDPDQYRAAALDHLRVLLAVDAYMTESENPRFAWTVCAIVFNLTSIRCWTEVQIANHLGASPRDRIINRLFGKLSWPDDRSRCTSAIVLKT